MPREPRGPRPAPLLEPRAKRGQRPGSTRSRATGGLFAKLCLAKGLPKPEAEYPFSAPLGRKHRADFCWVKAKVILEVDGGVWLPHGGRHTRGAGWLADTEKMWLAARLGYRWVRCTPQQLTSPATFDRLREILA